MVRVGLGASWRRVTANDNDAKKGASYAANFGDDHLRVCDVAALTTDDVPGHVYLCWASPHVRTSLRRAGAPDLMGRARAHSRRSCDSSKRLGPNDAPHAFSRTGQVGKLAFRPLSDSAAEEAVRDRLSFRRFCGPPVDVETPDHASIWRFRQTVDRLGLSVGLLTEVNRRLDALGFVIKRGTAHRRDHHRRRGQAPLTSAAASIRATPTRVSPASATGCRQVFRKSLSSTSSAGRRRGLRLF
jgi:hypothetical protein